MTLNDVGCQVFASGPPAARGAPPAAARGPLTGHQAQAAPRRRGHHDCQAGTVEPAGLPITPALTAAATVTRPAARPPGGTPGTQRWP